MGARAARPVRRSGSPRHPRRREGVGPRVGRHRPPRDMAPADRSAGRRHDLPAPRGQGTAAVRRDVRGAGAAGGRPMSTTRTSDMWWKNAVIYCLDVETFLDWNDDGVGDFAGLSERIDYLAGMGVSCLWLMPFYPSPNRDDGYDVTDYYGVDE